MRRAIGFIIVLYGVTYFFEQATADFERAASASFQLIEVVAQQSATSLMQ
jgi:hypothetical protein